MRREGKQWRISRLPDAVHLTTADVRRVLRRVSVYHVTRDRSLVVPEPVFLPEQPSMATAMVQRLLRGPGRALSTAVESAFPSDTTLRSVPIPVRDGVAMVDLSPEASNASQDERQAMSAQLIWTLRHAGREIRAVRISVRGGPLFIETAPEDQPLDAWSGYDGDLMPVTSPYLVQDGRLGRLDERRFDPVAGAVGDGRVGARSPAVNADASSIAALSRDGRTVYAGSLAHGDTGTVVAQGAGFSRPSWDRAGNLWITEPDTGRVWTVTPGQRPRRARLQVPSGRRVLSLRLSRDGVRAALVARAGRVDELYVVTVVPPGATEPAAVADVQRVAPTLRSVLDVGWADAGTVVVLGDETSGLAPQLRSVSVDGYAVTPLSTTGNLRTIAVAPGRPLLGGTGAGLVVESSGRTWRKLTTGRDPAYPG